MDELRCMSLHIFIIGSLQTIYFEMLWTQRNRHSDSGIYSNSVFCVCVTRHRFQWCPTIDETRSIFGVVVLRQYWTFTLLLNYWKKTFSLGIKQKRGQNSSNLEPILNEYQTLSRNFHWIRASKWFYEKKIWETKTNRFSGKKRLWNSNLVGWTNLVHIIICQWLYVSMLNVKHKMNSFVANWILAWVWRLSEMFFVLSRTNQ